MHDTTIAVPPEHRRRSADLVAIAVFDWPDESGFLPAPAKLAAAQAGDLSDVAYPDDPFWNDVAAARPHPHASVVRDKDTGSFYAALWLTAAEFTGPRTERPRQGLQLTPDENLLSDDARIQVTSSATCGSSSVTVIPTPVARRRREPRPQPRRRLRL
jgi:hypothetical protein